MQVDRLRFQAHGKSHNDFAKQVYYPRGYRPPIDPRTVEFGPPETKDTRGRELGRPACETLAEARTVPARAYATLSDSTVVNGTRSRFWNSDKEPKSAKFTASKRQRGWLEKAMRAIAHRDDDLFQHLQLLWHDPGVKNKPGANCTHKFVRQWLRWRADDYRRKETAYRYHYQSTDFGHDEPDDAADDDMCVIAQVIASTDLDDAAADEVEAIATGATPEQRAMMDGVLNGQTQDEIAAELQISTRTVQRRLRSMA